MEQEISRESIMKMEPGKELNKLVAEKVLDWQIYHYDKDLPENCYYMLVDEHLDPVANDNPWSWTNGERKTEDEAWRDCPDFSGDLATAWKIITKMREKDWHYVIESLTKGHHARFFKEDGCYGEYNSEISVEDAICKAALYALEDDTDV